MVNPRDIFTALPDKPWSRLRPEQTEVLKAWFERRGEKDLVIKQNTGGGKTLVGLLIAQSSLNEGVGPVVYLVPDTFLIEQVITAAGEVGIAVTDNPKDERFRSSRATLVTTFDKLVNGRSHFGVRGVKSVIPLGVVIVDDAHTALASARNQFSASLPASKDGYGKLLALFSSDLRRQSAKTYADLIEGDFSAPLRVPPRAVKDRAQQVLDILREHGEDDTIKSFYFSWPFVADLLKVAVITFTHRNVEIKTPCPYVDLIPAFSQARRRVYLTATLADEGVLVTELGAGAGDVVRPITPERASDLGDRIILAPLSINPSLSETSIRELAREYADGIRDGIPNSTIPINVVVLVPSTYAASFWKPYADEVLTVDTMKPVIKKMTDGEHVGVIVLINKYDGVDLPWEACRILIIDGVPTPLAPSERREAAALIGSPAFDARKVQRIEQGMGRGIRDLEDFCAVLLLTRETSLTLRDENLRRFYSPATRAQIELSQQIADQIENEGIGEIRKALDMFLARNDEWVASSRAAVAEVEYDQVGSVSQIAIARRQAFDKIVAGDADAAISILRRGIDTVDGVLEKGWFMEELSSYQELVDPMGAQSTLLSARERNSGVLKPDVAPAIKPLRGPHLQGQAASEYLGSNYSDANTLRLRIGSLFDNIVWGVEDTSDLAEDQIRLLGLHLGFASTRPEKEDQNGGPDNLWGLTPTTNAVIELKVEVRRTDTRIIKSEAGQLLTSLEWDDRHNRHVTKRVPVLVHPCQMLHDQSNLPTDTRVITFDDLGRLRIDVTRFIDELAASKSWMDETSVTQALKRNKLTAEQVIAAHSSKLLRSS